MFRFFLVFLGIQGALFALELTPPVQSLLVAPWTAMLARWSAMLVTLFDSQVIFYANIIQNKVNGFGVAIQPGCNGVEACIVLIAAMLAFPAPWMHKLQGIALGVIAVQAVNILRVISLFYIGQWRTDVFDFAHLYLWQALIMLDVLVVWLIWVRAMPARGAGRYAA